MFGTDGLASLSAPVMIIVGTEDRTTPADENGIPAYESVASSQKALALLQLAGHYVFVEKCIPLIITLGRFNQCSDLVWDMDRAHDLTNHLATAFFLAVLYDDPTARAALSADAVDFVGVEFRSTF
jgi:predicted dienelactone hydrolase